MQIHVDYQTIHDLSQKLAIQVFGFNPDFIVAIGGGGLIPARIMRTILKVPVLVITAESYSNKEQTELSWRQWLDKPNELNNKRILIVDELDDTGKTLQLTCERLLKECNPSKLAVAVLHYKAKDKKGKLPDDVTCHVGEIVEDKWIVYPWE